MKYLVVTFAYILCHGVTALVFSPIQALVLPETTVFASLIYLPHGVRVLATWAYGWRAIPPLIVGVTVSAWLFRPAAELNFLEPALLEGIVMGAISAFLAFELMRFLGFNFYIGCSPRKSWKGLMLIGAISSIINSIGQTFVFSGLIDWDKLPMVLVTYAIGDMVGLVVCMVVLMYVFRWLRLGTPSRT